MLDDLVVFESGSLDQILNAEVEHSESEILFGAGCFGEVVDQVGFEGPLLYVDEVLANAGAS